MGILAVFFEFYPSDFMGTLVISLLTLFLLLTSAFVVLVVLMQRTSQNGGMGAALGGGAAESAFGSETNNILTKATIYGIIAFFFVALVLYLVYQSQAADRAQTEIDATTLIRNEVSNQSVEAAAIEEVVTEGTNEVTTESVEAVAPETVVTEEAAPASDDAK